MNPYLQGVLHWYETLSPEKLSDIGCYYQSDAHFRDPFNNIRGRSAIHQVFLDMFDSLDNPRFVILETISDASQAFITWDFSFARHGRAFTIHGSSHFRFGEDGRIKSHRDYWDAAEELYEKIPVLGWILKTLKKKLQVTVYER